MTALLRWLHCIAWAVRDPHAGHCPVNYLDVRAYTCGRVWGAKRIGGLWGRR